MATATQREQIIALVVGMFDAAPGANYLNQLVVAFDGGMTLSAMANVLATKGAFTTIYPPNNTNEEIAAKVVENLLGTNVSAEAKTWSTNWVVGQLNAGVPRAQVILQAIDAIRATTNTNYTAAKAELANKVDVATYYSVTKNQSDTDLADLQQVVSAVTSDPASVIAAKAAVDGTAAETGGQTFTLTVGVNTGAAFTGGAANDTFNSPLATGLSALDNINGGGGTDTLNIYGIDVNGVAAAIAIPASATVSNIEIANIVGASTVNGSVSSWTGLETLNVVAVGGTTAQAMTVGAADVNFDNTASFAANSTGGTIGVTGGKSVSITNNLAQSTLGQTTTGGAITVTGNASTTGVTVTQTAPVTPVAAAAGSTESAVVTWQAMAAVAGSQTIGGMTITSDAVGYTAAQVATVAGGGVVAGLSITTAPTAWTVAAAVGATNEFTSTTANSNVADIGGAAFTGAGNSVPTAVTTQGVAAVAGSQGVVNGNVSITDANSASTTAAGTITSVNLTNFGAATINSGALNSVTLTGKGGSLNAGTLGALTTATATATVALNLVGFESTGAVTLDADVKTLNIAGSSATSTLNSLSATGATAVNLSGDKMVVLTGNTFAATAAITSTNTAGVTIGTAIAAGSSFAGGAGADTITLSASGTKAITMGAGNDTVTYAGVMGTGGSVDAGEGTDTIKMTAAQAATATGSTAFAATVSNFEVLEISAATAGATAINMANADGMNSLTTNAVTGGALTITNAAANFTYTQKAASTDATSISLAVDTGTTDNVNLAFSHGAGFTNTGMLTVANVETLTITTIDSAATANVGIVAPITAAAATTVTVAGGLGVSLIGGMTQTVLTSLDASGLTGTTTGGLIWTSGALAAAATVKGGAAGTNTIDFSAATKAVTYTGGTGIDTINFAGVNTQANVVTLGNGANVFNGGTNAQGNNTITGGTGVDTILVANGNNTISAGAGADVITVGSGANTLTLGAGNDTVNFVATSGSSAVFTTITDIAAGDILDFTGTTGGGVANANGALGAALVSGVNDYQTFLNAAAGAGQGRLSWFQFGGDTYLVKDGDAGTSFAAGTDHVVKLTGLVDLSTAVVSTGDVLTIA